jgi:Domain of unknown function (DUF222)
VTTSTTSLPADFAATVARVVADAECLTRMAADGAWSRVSLASAADLAVALLRAGDSLTAAAIDGVGVVHTSGALPAGHVSTKRWLEVATGMSATSAKAKVARSMSLREGFARTRMAWLSGQISDDMVRVITIGIPLALKRLNVAEQPALIDQIEAQIVPYAMEKSIPEVQAKLTRLRISLDADGVDERSLAAYDEQQLTLIPVGDGYEVRGYLSKESAAVLLTVLEQKIDGWFRDGSLTPELQSVAGDDVMSTGRRKMRRPRLNADALIEVCEDLLNAGALGSKHQQRPHVLVTVDAAEYRAGLGGLLHLPGTEADPVTAATVDQYLCDAEITTVLTRTSDGSTGTHGDAQPWLHDAAREVLYVGRSRRTAPPRLRKALAIRDQHCVFPGCRVDPSRCDAHHVREWVDDGLTDPSNMLLLCRSHHTVVHRAGWTITRRSGHRDGQPDGWDISPPPRKP